MNWISNYLCIKSVSFLIILFKIFVKTCLPILAFSSGVNWVIKILSKIISFNFSISFLDLLNVIVSKYFRAYSQLLLFITIIFSKIKSIINWVNSGLKNKFF